MFIAQANTSFKCLDIRMPHSPLQLKRSVLLLMYSLLNDPYRETNDMYSISIVLLGCFLSRCASLLRPHLSIELFPFVLKRSKTCLTCYTGSISRECNLLPRGCTHRQTDTHTHTGAKSWQAWFKNKLEEHNTHTYCAVPLYYQRLLYSFHFPYPYHHTVYQEKLCIKFYQSNYCHETKSSTVHIYAHKHMTLHA